MYMSNAWIENSVLSRLPPNLFCMNSGIVEQPLAKYTGIKNQPSNKIIYTA